MRNEHTSGTKVGRLFAVIVWVIPVLAVATGAREWLPPVASEHGPGIDHAPFIVSVETPSSLMGPFEVVRAGRLATTVRKQFIIAIPDSKAGKIRYLVFSWFKA